MDMQQQLQGLRWKAGPGPLIWGGACGLLGLMGLLLLAGLLPRFWHHSDQPCELSLYVVGNKFHTNLVLPVQSEIWDWRDYLDLDQVGQLNRADYSYLAFGWGDRDFYLSTPTLQDLDFGITVRAFFWPTASVMHVQGYPSLPSPRSDLQLAPVQVSREGYLRLARFIMASFEPDSDGSMTPILASDRYSGSFYRARGQYWMLRTCNDWTAEGLRLANVQTPLWSGLSVALFHHLQGGCSSRKKPPEHNSPEALQ